MDERSLVELLETSRRNNAKLEISGMLLYADGNFIQYIEGPEANVGALYDRIATDPRHRNLTVLSEGETDSRRFPDWAMGVRPLSREELSQVGHFGLSSRESIENRLKGADDALVLVMMKQFYAAAYPDAD